MATRRAVELETQARLEEAIRSVAAGLTIRELPEAGSLQSMSAEEILSPLRRVQVIYVAVVLLVGAAATMGFRLVTDKLFRSFDEFRGAIEQIAEGDFAPWLPPPSKDEVGWLSLALGRMTERMGQMIRSVEQVGRLAAVGEMAAYVAHEVRTPLSSIRMNLQLLERSAEAGLVPASGRVCIDTSLLEITRLEATVNRILKFSVPECVSRCRCSLHDLVSESAGLLRGAMESTNIVLRLDLSAESDWIWADCASVKGVFLNLLVNAMDEMPEGGETSVETQLFLGEGGRQMVAVAVSDSGPGVPPAQHEEIFHPFFTTKTDGCGIGLSAALRTLREHGGDLYLSQRPDGRRGACFVALFPLAPPNLARGFEGSKREPGARSAPWGEDTRRPSKTPIRWARIHKGARTPVQAGVASPGGRSRRQLTN